MDGGKAHNIRASVSAFPPSAQISIDEAPAWVPVAIAAVGVAAAGVLGLAAIATSGTRNNKTVD